MCESRMVEVWFLTVVHGGLPNNNKNNKNNNQQQQLRLHDYSTSFTTRLSGEIYMEEYSMVSNVYPSYSQGLGYDSTC